MVKSLSELAPAKINLFLRITGRREDGYHELDSLLVPVSLYDRLKLELHPAESKSVSVHCHCTAIGPVEDNLAYRAAREFLAEFDIDAAVRIDLQKNIPIGAGLGGGSSDAGAVLRMLAAACNIGRPAQLASLALRVGADVPFFLNPAASRVGGIGECIVPVTIAKSPILLAVPPIEVSTGSVFRELRPEQWSGRAPDEVVDAIVHGNIRGRHLINDLEPVTVSCWPRVGELRSHIEASGAKAAAMTGSGSGVFGIFGSRAEALRASLEVCRRAPEARIWVAAML